MLQAIHDRVTGWVAWIVVGLIGVTFALFGLDWYLKRDAQVYAASVNEIQISVPEYRFAKQQQIQRMRNMLGERFDASVANTDEFKQAVLNRLIEEELLVQAATDAGLAIGNDFLAARIHSIAEFQVDGEFNTEQYQRLLSSQGLNPQRFEQQFRRALLINQFAGSITSTAAVVASDVDLGLRLQGQERKLRYLRIPMARAMDNSEVKPDEIQRFYDENKSRFVEPEQVRLQYLELSLDTIAAGLSVTDEEIAQLYETDKQRLATEEQRRARHILLKLDESASEADVAAAQAKAEDLVKRLRAGEDFAALAKEYSQDPGSAVEGGDLGMFGKGMMVPEFETATFDLDLNAISDPVRSPFGLHIIQVTEIQPSSIPDLDSVREQLKQEALRIQAENLFFERAETLATLAFEHPDTLSLAAEQLGLTVQESDWLSQSGHSEGIGHYPQVIDAAFSDEVLTAGHNSSVLEVEDNHVFVVRLLEHKPSTQLALDVVRDAIAANLRTQNARSATAEQGAALLERLKAGAPLDNLASELQLEMQDAGFVARDGSGKHDRQIVMEAFRIPRTADGKIASAGVSLANGDYALIQVDEVRDGSLADVSEAARQSFRRNLDQLYGNLETTALLEHLKAKAEIVRVDDRLD